MTIVTLFTKEGCHLCKAARAVIDQAAAHHPFELIVRDILDNPADYDRYKHDIPVIAVNGQEIARHRITAAELTAALKKANPDSGS